MAPLRSLRTLFLPGGVLLAAGLILLRPGILPSAVQSYLHGYPYLVFAVGLGLSWYFHRSRVVFALLILAVAGVALRGVGPDGQGARGVGDVVFVAVATLVPANLAVLAVQKERGLFTPRGVLRLFAIALQIAAVDFTIRVGWDAPYEWLTSALLDPSLMTWTPLPQASLAAFGCAAGLLTIRSISRRDPVDAGLLWALLSVLSALQGYRSGWSPLAFLATGGLALIWASVETTYRMAYYDELTGLPGRRALNEALLRVGSRYAVAMVDVDHFKRLNDVFGHDVGDQALRMVAAKLSGIGGGGKAFRYGGEEFVVLFARAAGAEAVPHLEAARRTIAESSFVLRSPRRPRKKPATPKPRSGPQVAVSLTISIGLAEPDPRKGKVSPQHVLRAADKALYRAKGAGRNRLMV